jgi:hypothetical protein
LSLVEGLELATIMIASISEYAAALKA